MKKSFYILLFAVITLQSAYSQGYQINFQIFGLSNSQLVIANYFAGKVYALDTVKLDYQGKGVYTGTEKLKQGMYICLLPSGKYNEFLVGNDQFFSFSNDASGGLENLRFEGSAENTALSDYGRFLNSKRAAVENDSGNELLRNQISQEILSRQLKLIHDFKGEFISVFFNMLVDINVPDYLGDDDRYYYYMEHYFDNFDFAAEGLIRTPVFGSKVDTYIKKIEDLPVEQLIGYLNKAIKKAEVAHNTELYQYLVKVFFNYFSSSKNMMHEGVYNYMAKKYYFSDKNNWTSQGWLDTLINVVNKQELCLIGEYAQEIQGVDLYGKPISLYQSQSDFTLIIFWDESCSICPKYLAELRDIYRQLNTNRSVQVFAINLGYSKTEAIKFINANRLQAFNHMLHTDLTSEVKKLYDVSSMPRVYVLNKDKIIIGKKISIANAQVIVENYTEVPVSVLSLLNKDNREYVKELIYDQNTQKTTPDKAFDNPQNIDVNIPLNYNKAQYRFALIIGNEHYSKFQNNAGTEIDVPFAMNDALIFKEYAQKTLGVPERNIELLTDATLGQMLYAISKINKFVKYSNGNAEVIFYYAGHGLPNEQTKESYLVPVDGNGSDLNSSIKLSEVLSRLSEYENKGLTAFIDASFSGGARNKSLREVRGVKIVPKQEVLQKTTRVFYACSENQSAWAYPAEKHGLFTYQLLKKIKETQGSLTFGELHKDLSTGVSSLASQLNKIQKPALNASIPNWAEATLLSEQSQTYKELQANIDLQIPKTGKVSPNTFAFIIGNEDYTTFQTNLNSEANVEFAQNDAQIVKKYMELSLGVPKKNIVFVTNTTLGQFNSAWNQFKSKVASAHGKPSVIFYYAGHGLPDENNEAYLMPVDVSGSNIKAGIKLSDFYKQLAELPSLRTTVFLDACFSGGARNQGLVSVRGVKIKPKEASPLGNLLVFTSSSGEESSAPYKEKKHGLFTYFLLNKIKEANGQLSYGELADYLINTIPLESVRINNKEQNPQVNSSPSIGANWRSWALE